MNGTIDRETLIQEIADKILLDTINRSDGLSVEVLKRIRDSHVKLIRGCFDSAKLTCDFWYELLPRRGD